MNFKTLTTLRYLRSQRGLLRKDVAAAVGCSEHLLGSYELRSCRASLMNALRLAEFYGVAVSDLFESPAGGYAREYQG